MMNKEEQPLTMCWFGFYQPYATSIVHIPEQEISPNEIDEKDLIFIWDKYMKADLLTDLLNYPVPWSPALIEGYSREWKKRDNGLYTVNLVKRKMGKCLGAVLLTSRLTEEQLKPLIDKYKKNGYSLQKTKVTIGDHTRDVPAFLPE